jgi:hypothetical protein
VAVRGLHGAHIIFACALGRVFPLAARERCLRPWQCSSPLSRWLARRRRMEVGSCCLLRAELTRSFCLPSIFPSRRSPSAPAVKIYLPPGTPTQYTLSTGVSVTLTFRLQQPILCTPGTVRWNKEERKKKEEKKPSRPRPVLLRALPACLVDLCVGHVSRVLHLHCHGHAARLSPSTVARSERNRLLFPLLFFFCSLGFLRLFLRVYWQFEACWRLLVSSIRLSQPLLAVKLSCFACM